MESVIIQVALTGAVTTRDDNPNLPISVEENVAAAIDVWKEGASVVHIHAREEDGEPTQRLERFAPIVEGIRAANCDVILNLTCGTAGSRVQGPDRYECLSLLPEMCSFDCGTLNFGDRVVENSPQFLRALAVECLERGVKPEIECFDVGHIGAAMRLRDEGLLEEPLHFQFVLGIPGGAPATIEQAMYMRSLIPKDATWSICAIGRHQLPMNLLCLTQGGHVRTGFEDNVYYHKGVLADSNAELVKRIVRIADEVGRLVATTTEARELLSLPAATPTPR